jgi:hypothetical protein
MCPDTSAVDRTQGFTITNNTSQNVYIQSGANKFDVVKAGCPSVAYTASWSYSVHNDSSAGAPVYLTVVVSGAENSVNIKSGSLVGSLTITTNFA